MNAPAIQTAPPRRIDVGAVIDPALLVERGFSAIPDWLGCREDIPPGAKIVYGKILSFLRMGRQFPSREEIGVEVGLGVRQVSNHLELLKKKGLLQVTRRNRLSPNNYKLLDNSMFRQYEASRCKILPIRSATNFPSDRQDLASSSNTEREEKEISPPSEERAALRCAPLQRLPQAQEKKPAETVHENKVIEISKKRTDAQMSSDRLERAKMQIQLSSDKSRKESLLRETKRRQKAQSKADADNNFPAARRLEEIWRVEMGRRHTDRLIPRWSASEIATAIRLVKRANVTVVEDALMFVVRYWEKVFAYVLGPNRPVEEGPTLRFLDRHADKILLVSQGWAEHRETWEKVAAWRRNRIDEYDPMPRELEEEAEIAARAVRGFGFGVG